MSALAEFAAAGYHPLPMRLGRPIRSSRAGPYWHGHVNLLDTRFADCPVALACTVRPLSECLVGLRWSTPTESASGELGALVERHAGAGPVRVEGDKWLRVFRLAGKPFAARALPRLYLPGEPHRASTYTPHAFAVLAQGAFLEVSGGTWRNGSLPAVRCEQLPTLSAEQAGRITCEVEALYRGRGALPWV